MTEQIYNAILLTWDYFHSGHYRFTRKGQSVFIKKRKFAKTEITHMALEVGRMKFQLNTANLEYEKFMEYVDQICEIACKESADNGR